MEGAKTMKKILALAALAALTTGVSAYAANPFADVSTSDWAYQAVVDLSDQGIVEGYPDGTFKGEKNVTRYEMAQIIARLMAKEDQLNAEQQATINKLASEYADELANLGVRVSNLEKKVGNIYWSGDARVRYQKNSFEDTDAYNGRLRIHVKGQVNDATYVQGTLTSNMNFRASDDAVEDPTKNGVVYAEQLFVNYDFGDKVSVRLGRQPVVFGNQGGWFYNSAKGYDGIQATLHSGKVDLTAGYGQLNDTIYDTYMRSDLLFGQGSIDLTVAKLNLNYISSEDHEAQLRDELMGAGLTIPVKDFRVFGEYWRNTIYDEYNTAWNAGIGYGKIDLEKPGTFALDLAYNHVSANTYFGGTGFEIDVFDNLLFIPEMKFWNVMGDVVLGKNLYLHGEYAFNVKGIDGEGDEGSFNKQKDAWTLSLNYRF